MEQLSQIQQINTAIMFENLTNAELESIISAVKFARARIANNIKHSVKNGSTVRFTSTKTGRTMTGTVEKVAIKYVTVLCSQGRWKVPANMLEVQ